MSKLSGGASYLTKESVPAKRLSTPKRSPVMVAVSAFFALLVLFISVQPLMGSFSSAQPQKAHAEGFELFCTSKIGLWMDDKSDWQAFLKVYPQENEKNRVWTLQEAFGNGATFVNYEGEGKGPDKQLVIDKSPENTYKPGNYSAVEDKLNGARTESGCFWPGFATSVANFGLWTASATTNIVQTFVVFAFDSSIICEDPANPTGVCLNLLKVVGGTGTAGDGGLIGILTGSIYMPLLVIMVTITAFWIGYKGLVQRKLREAMFGAIWVCLSVIFGLALLLNPALLAKAPMAVSNSVASCVIGSFNGQNCMDSSTGTESLKTDSFSTSSDKICRSIAPGASLDAQMSMTVNSLSCSIWKAFVLEPYAQGSFGTSFEKLDVSDPDTKKLIEKAGIDPNVFCVNLGSSESLASFSGKRAVFDKDTGKVCNLLAYQMFLKTDASTTGSATPGSGAVDSRWYNLIVTTANDEGLWAQWAPSLTNSMHKNATAVLAIITSLAGGIVLVIIAFFALLYYLTSVILMAFAPLFFLFGVHPGRGKKILLGWVEKVVSNVLKYLASAIFLIVAISFYAAILGSATSPALTFLFVVIMSFALAMYRKEIVELIGKASMGGEQLSSKFAESLKDRAQGVGGLALAGVGSGVGAAIAGGRVSSGIKAGIQRDLQRGGAKKVFGNVGGEFVGNATRQFARNTVDNERDVKEAARSAKIDANTAAEERDIITGQAETAYQEIVDFDAAFYVDTNNLNELNDKKDAYSDIETAAAREMLEENPYFAQAQLIANQIAALNFDKSMALSHGDQATADLKTAEMQQLDAQRQQLLGQISTDDLARNREEYSNLVEDKAYRAGIDYTDADENKLIALTNSVQGAQDTRDDLVATSIQLTERRGELETSAAGLRAKEEELEKQATNIQPGDMVTKKKSDKMLAAGEKAFNDSVKEVKTLPMAERLSMDAVYVAEHTRVYGGPRNGDENQPRGYNDSTGDDRGPQDPGSSDGGTRGPQGPQGPSPMTPRPSGIPTPEPATTRPLPTSPRESGSVGEERRSSERTSSQQDRGSGLPTQPVQAPNAPVSSNPVPNRASETPVRFTESPTPAAPIRTETPVSAPMSPQPDRAPAAPTRPTAPPSAPAQPVVAPSVPAQPARETAVPAQPSAQPNVSAQSQAAPAPYVAPTPLAREPAVPNQPASTPRIPTQPAQAPSTPAQPAATPRVPVQPAQAPSAPVQQQAAPAPQVATAPASTPTQPASAPRIPTQPAQAPSTPAQPAASPRVPTQPAQTPVVPAQPVQEPTVPARPSREPNSPMTRDGSNRGVPLAQDIRLPSSPQASRVNENSPTPSISINRSDRSDNEAPTQGMGIPRRRGTGNN